MVAEPVTAEACKLTWPPAGRTSDPGLGAIAGGRYRALLGSVELPPRVLEFEHADRAGAPPRFVGAQGGPGGFHGLPGGDDPLLRRLLAGQRVFDIPRRRAKDRKSTRLNSSH